MQSDRNLARLTVIVFGIFYCLESLVNHYLFRTYMLDLGLSSHAMHNYAHLRMDISTLILPEPNNSLCYHFSLYPMLFSPLSYIFCSYTLLIVQIAAILWGGWGCYIYFREKTTHRYLPVLAQIHFYSIWAIYSALSFDFHDNVVAAMILPWLIYFFEKQRWKPFFICFLAILIAKENMALWMAFVAIGLFIANQKSKPHRIVAMVMGSTSILFFVVTINIIMPYFDLTEAEQIGQIQRYTAFGSTWGEILVTMITKPALVIAMFLNNTTGEAVFNGIKAEQHLMIILAGGWALLFRPTFLIMLIPIYAQKFLSNNISFWGINDHYSIEFVPVLTIALFTVFVTVKKSTIVYSSAIFAVLLTFTFTLVKMNTRVSKWYNPMNTHFFRKVHYERDLDVQMAYKIIKSIPKNAAVSAHSVFIPHLALRDKIYWFPDMKDATYVFLPINESVSTWPYSRAEYDKAINNLIAMPGWKIAFRQHDLLLLRKE